VILVKQNNGSYIPAYPADDHESKKVKVGTEVKATRARNVKYHRKGFALLNLGFENQDTYDNFEVYRQVITIKAGFVTWVKGKDEKEYPFPNSLSFDKMNAKQFEDWYAAILEIISKETKLSGAEIELELAGFY